MGKSKRGGMFGNHKTPQPRKTRILCAVAVMDQCEPTMISSYVQARESSRHANVDILWQIGDSAITRIRNHAYTECLDRPEYEWYAQWSADIEVTNCTADDNVWDRLLAHGKEFIGGVYRPSSQGPVACTSFAVDGKPVWRGMGLVELSLLSGGLQLIHRSVLERMDAAYPELRYNGMAHFEGRTIRGFACGDLAKIPDGRTIFFTEDYWAVTRAKQIGVQIWGDTDLTLKHWGKYPYRLPTLEQMNQANAMGADTESRMDRLKKYVGGEVKGGE